jgi:muramoyltetrapeptide carboxypeptidase
MVVRHPAKQPTRPGTDGWRNLTLVGARWDADEIETAGKILFLEEVGEEPYSIDRMLSQLRQAGKLEQAAGILVDRCARCKPADYKPAFYNSLSVEEVLEDLLGDLDCPVLIDLSIGHGG